MRGSVGGRGVVGGVRKNGDCVVGRAVGGCEISGACENVSGAVGACDSVVRGGCSAVGENNGGINRVSSFFVRKTRNDTNCVRKTKNDGMANNEDSSLCGCEAQNDGKDEILRRPFASLRASA